MDACLYFVAAEEDFGKLLIDDGRIVEALTLNYYSQSILII
ncbi:MAG: hypothetical protein RQ875_00400 [Vicingaceae bacterium]|nr:hypothetical protein [Vicingaceae bacterium]